MLTRFGNGCIAPAGPARLTAEPGPVVLFGIGIGIGIGIAGAAIGAAP
jgi:hypothetical protein